MRSPPAGRPRANAQRELVSVAAAGRLSSASASSSALVSVNQHTPGVNKTTPSSWRELPSKPGEPPNRSPICLHFLVTFINFKYSDLWNFIISYQLMRYACFYILDFSSKRGQAWFPLY